MTDLINLSARYVIKTEQFGSENALASTPDNDTLVLESISSDTTQSQLWYFEETELDDYYRLHTEDKGNGNSLSTYNYEGSQTTDLRFRANENIDAQYWRLEVQGDGSVKVSNSRAGSESYLDVEDGSLKPFLAQGDSGNGEWTLSTFGAAAATPTPTVSTSSDATTTPAATPSCTSECTVTTDVATTDGSKSSALNKGAIIGIAVGGAAGLLAIIGIAVWLWRRRRRGPSRPRSVPMRQGHILG
ncbi:uncharacterized protein J4E84_000899 [Alternaria hordeiaustralica]|uniref:uncharacterized protein n=1 Tax=Alternaria hordeiaustralica TaxID=1187925 RepID=UPI0020C4F7BF|nr:uncharacterized protein J4E84_000899 [Alternaria hordeiaustralica]KAI4697766.1 hypothetical protein J4E84_000899 [Alternaria hordeiaustralica]